MQRIRSDIADSAPLKTASHSFEARIGDEMELRGDMVGRDVPNETHGGRVNRRETKELTAAGAWFPFRNLLTVLKAGIKNVDRTTEDASAAKIITTGARATEQLNRGHAVGTGNVVIEPGSVRKCERPKARIVLVGPMDLKVKEHSAGAASDGSNGAFSVGVLMVCTNT